MAEIVETMCHLLVLVLLVLLVLLIFFAPVKDYVFGSVTEYVGYIGSYDDNLKTLRTKLEELGSKKDDIEKKVEAGKSNQEQTTAVAALWLQHVRALAYDEVLKRLIYKDIDTAKFVVKMMRKKDLKILLSKESELQEVAVKVLKKLKEDMEKSNGEMRINMEVDYKKVAEVVVELLKDTFQEFKKLILEDKKMAVIAMRTLELKDLHILIAGDLEMEKIFREAGNESDEELRPNHEDESDAPLLKRPVVDSNKNRAKEIAEKLFTPVAYLLTPLGKLMDDATFKKAVPEAANFKLRLDVIDGLFVKSRGMKKEMDENTQQHRGCCCSLPSLCELHGRYEISKDAKLMADRIEHEFISNYPRDPVTLPIPTADLKPIPTESWKPSGSRAELLDKILKQLNDDQVNRIGVFGMGGTGKTTLAKDVSKRVNKDLFNLKAMVEVSDVPDIVRIQATIAESIDLKLHDVDVVGQRALKLYNKLSEKDNKVLIILDNVWGNKLNLDEIGIPSTCKLLLTTREKEVCKDMGVQEANIHMVDLMTTNEARELFKSQLGVDIEKYKDVVDKVLSKCGGLPLAIAAIINILKNKDPRSWGKFADDEIEKPISSQISDDYHHIYAILRTSYKFIGVEDKRIFFLLVSLSPIGSTVSIDTLMRYGIGLNLFQRVNKLSEAMELADKWVNELVLSSMLLEGDKKGEVKIHDVVRDFAILYAAKEERHKFMVEGIPRWMNVETFRHYTAMSLISRNDWSRLNGVEARKLKILTIKGDMSPNFSESFFKGMVNLEVLALSNMNFHHDLPDSMRKLKKMKTLCIEGCELGDIKLVGEMVNLLVLSLRGSVFNELPAEIGNLGKLRLLDLSGCICGKEPLLPTSLLDGLSELEGLYTITKRRNMSVFEKNVDEDKLGVVSSLPYLNAFEINVPEVEDLAIDGQSLLNVDKFRVFVGPDLFDDENLRLLSLSDVDDLIGVLEKSCVKILLKRVDYLRIETSGNFENIVPKLDEEGFKHLGSLQISDCDNVKCIVDGQGIHDVTTFSSLRSLHLYDLTHLEMICDGEATRGMFSNLQTLYFDGLDMLEKGLPLVPRNLIEINTEDCELLNFILTEDEETEIIVELHSLKSLKCSKMPGLLSLVGPKKLSNTNHTFCDPFFDSKRAFPSLELFELRSCNSIGKLWNMKVNTCGFQNLKEVRILHCNKLLNVGSIYVFSVLVQLETLCIQFCHEMREIVTVEETGGSAIGEQIIRFPGLKNLTIESLPNLESFYAGKSTLEFPKLEQLKLDGLYRMESFAKLENRRALFNEMISFPCLENLYVTKVSDEISGLWDSQALSVMLNPSPMLRHLTLGSSAGLRNIPSIILENLSSLSLTHYENDEVIFSLSDVETNVGFVWRYSQLPRLETLKVKFSASLIELIKADEWDGDQEFYGQLKTLELGFLDRLKHIPVHLFKALESLTLEKIEWQYVVSGETLGDSLQQLQFLNISQCGNMGAVVIDVVSTIELPRLKELVLDNLRSIKSFCSTTNGEATLHLPSLESLEIRYCYYMEHFWSGSIVAPRLQRVRLVECRKMQELLVGNTEHVTEFSSLQQLCIDKCPNMKTISSGPLNAPKLRQVAIYGCRSMEWLLQGNPNHNGVLELPSLEVVTIKRSPNLYTFSLTTHLVTPKLTHIEYDDDEYSMQLYYYDLNDFLMKMVSKHQDGEEEKEEEEEEEEEEEDEEEEEEEEEEEDEDEAAAASSLSKWRSNKKYFSL